MFKALVVSESDGSVTSEIKQLEESDLPEGDLTIRVEKSTLNYKDGMVVKGIGKLVKTYPHVPGVDMAGEVVESKNPAFREGDGVLVTGFRVGETYWGGYSQLARVNSNFALKLPNGLGSHDAMAIGTAGLSAMLALMALEEHGLRPSDDEVLVTGAAGGVGSIAVAILHGLGYKVAASTGRPEEAEYLRGLGATSIIERSELSSPSQRPLESERWSGCIDAVGGFTLARVISQLKRNASVAAVGLAGGGRFDASVMPFLLRGVNLLGIDSVMAPLNRREVAWSRLRDEVPKQLLGEMTREVELEEVPKLAEEILAGKVRGRIVVKLS